MIFLAKGCESPFLFAYPQKAKSDMPSGMERMHDSATERTSFTTTRIWGQLRQHCINAWIVREYSKVMLQAIRCRRPQRIGTRGNQRKQVLLLSPVRYSARPNAWT